MVLTDHAVVAAVSRDGEHRFSKTVSGEIILLPGLGVQGDAHAGSTVQHRSRVAAHPLQLNLRQVHLIHSELYVELRKQGFDVALGQLGENVVTAGVDLLGLPRDTLLQLAGHALIQVTGLRNPSLRSMSSGQAYSRPSSGDQSGNVVRKAGVMAIVVHGGPVRPGDGIQVRLPAGPHHALERV